MCRRATRRGAASCNVYRLTRVTCRHRAGVLSRAAAANSARRVMQHAAMPTAQAAHRDNPPRTLPFPVRSCGHSITPTQQQLSSGMDRIWALTLGNQPVTYGPQGRRPARLNRRIINYVAIARDRAANELAKRAAQLITRLDPVAPSCVAFAHAIARLAERDRRTTY